MNYYNVDLKFKSIHAEVNAINKLPYRFKNKYKKVNIIVCRVNNKNELLMAKPCDNCIKHIMNNLYKKKYKLNKLWYSDGKYFTQLKIT